jgi:hypothetical protein
MRRSFLLSVAATSEAAKLFFEGKSLAEASMIAGCTDTGLRRHLQRKGIQFGKRRRYTIDHDFFASLSSSDPHPDACRLAGFIAADGNVHPGRPSIRISQKPSDRDVLDTAARLTGTDAPLSTTQCRGRYGEGTPLLTLCWSSRKMVTDLAVIGIGPAKSLTLKAWRSPAHVARHWFRGLVDGDGWIFRHGSKHRLSRNPWTVGLCGTLSIVSAFAEFVKQEVGWTATPKPHKRLTHFWRVEYFGLQNAADVARLLYEGDGPAMARKRRLALQCVAASLTAQAPTAGATARLPPRPARPASASAH